MSDKPLRVRISDTLKKTTVEPFLFLVMFGYHCKMVTLQSLLHDRACRISLNFSDAVCADLDHEDNDYEQTHAVKFGNNIYNGVIVLSTLPALVMALFLGPWSDRYSRKYPILIATMAITIDASIQAVIASFEDASPYWFLASSPISGCTGGFIIVLSSTYSYMSDITNERSRQVRFAVLEFFTIMATPVAALVSGQLFKIGKNLTIGRYLPNMILSPCSFALAFLWMWFYVVETKPRRFDITKKEIFQDLFKLDNLKSSYKTCAMQRAGNIRMQIWFLLFASFSARIVHIGSQQIGFPYTRKIFKWDVSRYSYTTAIFSLVNACATLFIVPILNRKLLVHEAAVGLIGFLSLMAKMILMSVTVNEYILFYAWIAGTLYACSGIAVRSRISKLVPRKELGRVFSLLGTCESMTPVLGTALFLQIYNLTVDFYVGLPFTIAAIFLIPSAAIFGWMMNMPTMSLTQYEESEEAKKMEELPTVTSDSFNYKELKENSNP